MKWMKKESINELEIPIKIIIKKKHEKKPKRNFGNEK